MNQTVQDKMKRTAGTTGKVFAFFYRMRKVFLAVPLLAAAIYLAARNNSQLPAQVGFLLQDTGTFARMYPRALAVWVPFGVTATCIGMMFLSRKCLYPWLVGVLSLLIPILLLAVNQFGF